MKDLNKGLRNALYLVLPLCFFAVIHGMFCFVEWDSDPSNWSKDARFFDALLGLAAMAFGIIAANAINDK